MKETLRPQIAHCKSENRYFIQFRDDFLRTRQQPREVVQAQVGQSSVFHLTILTPTRNTNQQTAHDTNPWVFFFRLSLLLAFTSINSESARMTSVQLFPLVQGKIQTVDGEFARHYAASH